MEYTEEEKKAIEIVSNLRCYYNDESLLNEDELEENKINNNSIDLVLKLLEKQPNEIERLYKDNFRLDRENQLKFERAVDTSDYIPKEAIREKIKEIEDCLKEDCIALHEFQRLAKIDILKELLGE